MSLDADMFIQKYLWLELKNATLERLIEQIMQVSSRPMESAHRSFE